MAALFRGPPWVYRLSLWLMRRTVRLHGKSYAVSFYEEALRLARPDVARATRR